MKHLLFPVIFVLALTFGCQVIPSDQEDKTFFQPNSKSGLEATANKFAREWEQKDWGTMYNLFARDLQKLKSKDNFSELMSYVEQQKPVVIRLDRVDLESSKEGFAYYTVSSSLFDSKAPAMRFIYEFSSWRVDAFAKYFSMDLEGKKYADRLLPIIQQRLDLVEEQKYFFNAKDEESFVGGYLSSLYCKEIIDLIERKADLAGRASQIIPPVKYDQKHTSLTKGLILATENDINWGDFYCGEGRYNWGKRMEIKKKANALSSSEEYQNIIQFVMSFKEELEEKYS